MNDSDQLFDSERLKRLLDNIESNEREILGKFTVSVHIIAGYIKKGYWAYLLPMFTELNNPDEYDYPGLKKTLLKIAEDIPLLDLTDHEKESLALAVLNAQAGNEWIQARKNLLLQMKMLQ